MSQVVWQEQRHLAADLPAVLRFVTCGVKLRVVVVAGLGVVVVVGSSSRRRRSAVSPAARPNETAVRHQFGRYTQTTLDWRMLKVINGASNTERCSSQAWKRRRYTCHRLGYVEKTNKHSPVKVLGANFFLEDDLNLHTADCYRDLL